MSDHTLKLSSGLTLGYAEYGAADGVPVFYFHGWPSARVQGELMDETGAKLGLRFICPDRPGIGLSDFQPNRKLLDWPDTMHQLAEHVRAKKFHLIGWSGGGPYVLATALLMKERLLSATIVCGAPPLTFLGYQHMFWPYRVMIQLRRAFPSILGLILRMGERISRGEAGKPPLRWLLGMLGEADRRVLSTPKYFRVVRRGILESLKRGPRMVIADADIYLAEWGFEVSAVDFPVHFWHGKQDRNIDWRYTEQLAAIMPHATTHWFDDEGHYSLPISHVEEIMGYALKNALAGDQTDRPNARP